MGQDEFKGLTCVSPEVLAGGGQELTAHHQHVGQEEPVRQQDGPGTGSHPEGKAGSRSAMDGWRETLSQQVRRAGEDAGQCTPTPTSPKRLEARRTLHALGVHSVLNTRLL